MNEAKQVVTDFFEKLNDLDLWQNLISDDATWWLAGDLPLSGTYIGKEQIMNNYLAEVDRLLATRNTWINNMYLAGDTVIVEAQTEAMTKKGKPYLNLYAFIFEVSDNRIISVREYLDTESSRQVFE
ncbi:MAG: nuclear transport factor 2 family protein [Spongiibacteraceae bacterium]